MHCINICLDSKNEKNRREIISLFDTRGRSEFCLGIVNLEFDLDVCVHLLDDSDMGDCIARSGENQTTYIGPYS